MLEMGKAKEHGAEREAHGAWREARGPLRLPLRAYRFALRAWPFALPDGGCDSASLHYCYRVWRQSLAVKRPQMVAVALLANPFAQH